MIQPDSHSIGQPANTFQHSRDLQSVLEGLHTDPRLGLTSSEAARRMGEHGPNSLRTLDRTPWYGVLARQFIDVLILILVAAAAISLAVGELADAVTIMVIVVLNGALGFVQEWRAEKAIAALQLMLSPSATVIRDGSPAALDAADLVPGDIVLVELGDRIPADVRLVETLNLHADESALTGESTPVSKGIEPVAADAPIAERTPMIWMGTSITNGRARGVVVATGMQTQIGLIAQLTQRVAEERTPLQRRLAVLGKQLGVSALAVSAGTALTGWLLGRPQP